jgi:hypothetical protein
VSRIVRSITDSRSPGPPIRHGALGAPAPP